MANIGTLAQAISFLLVVLVKQSDECSFTPAYNQSLVDKVYHYFDEDSDVIVVEYVISLNVTPTSFDWSEYSDAESFQPWRWFRTQGSGNSRLLLSFYYYYGLFKDYLTFETRKVKVTLNPVPAGCVESIDKGKLDESLRDYLLRDFDINPKAVRHPYTPSGEVNVCSMYLKDIDGWGRLTYRCCRYDDDADTRQKKECHDVYNDGWVWTLRVFIIAFTIVLFLHLPSLIPGGHRVTTYQYTPTDDIHFKVVKTSHPERFSNIRNATVLNFHEWRKLQAFRTEVDQLEPEVTYNAHVQQVDCYVNNDRTAHKNESPVSFTRSFFDACVLCKIRHNRPVEECCHTSICGELCCGGTCCPPWHSWLRALRVIILMSVVALPALPLFYVMTADNLNYQELDEAHKERSLNTAFNFYPGNTFCRVIVGLLSLMYVLNTIILVVDGATDGRLTKLYSNVLEMSKRNSSIRQKSKLAKVVVRKFFRPIQKYGVYILPFWLAAMCFLPIVLIIFYIIDSPMARLVGHAVRKLLERMNVIAKPDLEADEKFSSFCKAFWFLISLIFVFVVITIGINFIVHLIAMVIVEIVVDASIVYQILPVVFFLLFYIRDSFHGAGEKYKKYLDTVLRSLIAKEEHELEREIRKPWPLEKNKMFQVSPGKFKQKPEDAGSGDASTSTTSASDVVDASGPGLRTHLFEVYRGSLWIRLQRVVLLLSKEEIVSTTKNFLFQACDMECYGSPGRLEENFILAFLDFLKVAVFLLFVFIAVMAYGSIYSISPTNHLFITLVTGLVPLVLKNVFKDKSEEEFVDITSFRYESELDQTIQSFVQNWELRDIIVHSIKREREGSDVTNYDQPVRSTLASTRMADYDQYTKRVILSTLVLNLNEDNSRGSDSNQNRPRSFTRDTPKQRSTRVGNASSFCSGGGEGKGMTDDVDKGKSTTQKEMKKFKNSAYRTENETERNNTNVWSPEEENGRYYSLSKNGKWKRKKKSRNSNLNEPPPPPPPPTAAKEMSEIGRQEPIIPNLDGYRVEGSGNEAFRNNIPTERPKVRRHDSSKQFRRFTTPPPSWYDGRQSHGDRQEGGPE